MRLFFDYIKQHIKAIALYLISATALFIVFILYELNLSAFFYALAVSLFFAVIFFVADYVSYRKKRIILQKLKENLCFEEKDLPEMICGVEKDCNELIISLLDEMRRKEEVMNSKYRDMTDYYTMWVHQIKTPISAMGLILQQSDSEDTAELSENLKRIESYAEMVLCYVRLQSDSTDFVIKEYDLDKIVRQSARKFSSQFIRKKLELKISDIDKKVLTDEKWLSFVIEQVVSNAVKYTHSGGVEIFLEEPLTLCIKDSGIGISQEDLPRIFENGFTGLNGRIDKKASGAGLYICKKICDKLGHRITAQSDENGTIIRIFLDSEKRILE